MHESVVVSYETPRGCGVRKPGAFYITSGEIMNECSFYPIPLPINPKTGKRMTPTRGLEEIYMPVLIENSFKRCPQAPEGRATCEHCLIGRTSTAYMIGVGEKFYPTVDSFVQEAMSDGGNGFARGISKRIAKNKANGMPVLPRGFRVGQSIVALAHTKAIVEYVQTIDQFAAEGQFMDSDLVDAGAVTGLTPRFTSGIFAAFIPQAIEYVLQDGEENNDGLIQHLVDHGIKPVYVVNVSYQQSEIEGDTE